MIHATNVAKTGFAEVLPLHTVTVPPYSTTNCVLYGDDTFVCIDPGSKETQQQEFLVKHIEERINKGHQLMAILLTHHHGDHTKGALMLKEQFKAPIMAHKHAVHMLQFAIDTCINDQEYILKKEKITLKAYHTPGHAQDHLVFYDEKNHILIAGDMITDRGTVLIPPNDGNLGIYMKSLEKLSHLSLTAVIPAHGQIITKDPDLFLLKALKHRWLRVLSVLHAIENQPDVMPDATDITHIVYQGSINENAMLFAQLSVESSLQWLLEHDLIQRVNYRYSKQIDAKKTSMDALLIALQKIDERLRNT